MCTSRALRVGLPPGQARRTMRNGCHPVEKMRRMPCAGVDARDRLIEVRSGVAQRDVMAGPHEPRDEAEREAEEE